MVTVTAWETRFSREEGARAAFGICYRVPKRSRNTRQYRKTVGLEMHYAVRTPESCCDKLSIASEPHSAQQVPN